MILDSDGQSCQMAAFGIGADLGTTRTWDIKVTQYKCGDFDISGQPGCLQYYTGLTNASVTKAIFCVKRVLISKNFKAFLIGKGFNLP